MKLYLNLWIAALIFCAQNPLSAETPAAVSESSFSTVSESSCASFRETFSDPPHEYTVMPFWFWNDRLSDEEIVRQIDDMKSHGVYGFVIHPRIGLPEDSGWMSPKLLSAMRTALTAAKERKMTVLLYDEGMYPSGSSAGQVAAANPRFAARGFCKVDLKPNESLPEMPELYDFVTENKRPDGSRIAIFEAPCGGRIRGLHYIREGERGASEFMPLAGDILSPDAANCFKNLVYERFYQEFGEFFGLTIVGIFTDEPSEMGRGPQKGFVVGNRHALKRVSEILGYDFTPHLADLWYNDSPESSQRRRDYYRAAHFVLIETYYKPLSEWCESHKIALCGHPGASNDLASERVFQIPGQDIVWRYVEPGEKALVGDHSTNAKVAASAMIHGNRTRNLNELYGAYGHNLTFEELRWLANWCLIRGQNLLVPHAFYYSVRGPRKEERPPDVGPNSPWWGEFRPYADACRRICWLNSVGKPVTPAAILTDGTSVRYETAKDLFENQIDFHYLSAEQLIEEAEVDDEGAHLDGMTYRRLILPPDGEILPENFMNNEKIQRLARDGRLVPSDAWKMRDEAKMDGMNYCDFWFPEESLYDGKTPEIRLLGGFSQTSAIRYRHLTFDEGKTNVWMLFNETLASVTVGLSRPEGTPLAHLIPETGAVEDFSPDSSSYTFAPGEMLILSDCARKF